MCPQKQTANSILTQNPELFVADVSEVRAPTRCLASSIGALDQFLEGGLRVGTLAEWGAPLGRGGRDIVLQYLARSEQAQQWCLWVCGKRDVRVYPPAWSARGVALAKVRFAYSDQPVRDLKPLFLDPFFRVIVLDVTRGLSIDDCAFLAQRARANKQVIIVLRNYFLSEKRGNVWAQLRLNCWQDEDGARYHIRTVRGLSPRQLSLPAHLIKNDI